MIFRWYDPRVLRVYLPTCTASELRTVFGPVERYLVDRADGDGLIEFSLGSQPFFHLAAQELPFSGGLDPVGERRNSDERQG